MYDVPPIDNQKYEPLYFALNALTLTGSPLVIDCPPVIGYPG